MEETTHSLQMTQVAALKEIYQLLDKLTAHYPPPVGLFHTIRQVTEQEKAAAVVSGDILFLQMEIASHKTRVMVFIDTSIGNMDFEIICMNIDRQLADTDARQQDMSTHYRGVLNVNQPADLADWFDAANPVVHVK